MKTETYACLGCGAEVERPAARGQRPKWCPDCRRKTARVRTCRTCGKTKVIYDSVWHCSDWCNPSPDRRSDMRRGYEEGDAALFFKGVRQNCKVDGSGCWVWQRSAKDGYPMTYFGSRTLSVHRVVLEVKHGAPLGSQAGHHICANTMCVNPEHLQPVTHRENTAEMLARRSYLARIAELEAALAEVAPNHPALRVIKVA